MMCVRPAARGGETLLADGFALGARALGHDPDFARRLFDEPRRIPFYFGDVVGRTIARWRDRVAFTHSPILPTTDLATRVRSAVDAAPIVELRPRAGDVLVVDNHRMLHGRRAFEDDARAPREFVRLLVWLARPLAVDDAIAKRARDANAEDTTARDANAPAHARDAPSARAAAVVDALLRGVAPGVLSARERVSESELYRWRDSVCRARGFFLTSSPSDVDSAPIR
jgi:hypothetical protein